MNTIGADVEVFAKDVTGNFKSLCGLIGGTKENPKPVLTELAKGFAIQEDNVSLEFNVPATQTRNNFVKVITLMKKHCEDVLHSKGFYISDEASASFSPNELLHPSALVFGCEPDYNAWSKMENRKPYSDDPCLRTAGGHIHVGTKTDMISLIKNMDLYLGVPSILLDDRPSSIKRRELYGKAGAMRPKPYGAEYRVLSNFWIFNTKTIGWVFDQTLRASMSDIKINKALSSHIQKTINTGDKDAAQNLIENFGLTLPA